MSNSKTPWGQLGRFASLGFELVLCVLIGLGIGLMADRYLGISPYGALGGLALGLSAAFWTLFKLLKLLK